MPACGFRRIHLKPGESVKVTIPISARQMALINDDGTCVLEPGIFRAFIGGSQPDCRSEELTGTPILHTDFEVKGKPLKMTR